MIILRRNYDRHRKKLLNKWCDIHDLTYFIDSDKKHCLCDVDWIIRFNTVQEMMDYIKEN